MAQDQQVKTSAMEAHELFCQSTLSYMKIARVLKLFNVGFRYAFENG